VKAAWGVAVCLAAAWSMAEELPRHPFFEKPILLGAHRGGAEWGPESTAETYRRLVATWPQALCEADVRVTLDGHPVVIHDETVDRTTDGTGKITEMTLAEAQALDAAYRWTPDGGATFPHRGQGYRIPTLEEAFAAAPENNWLIELKAGPLDHAEIIAREIVRLGMTHRVILASFEPAMMARAHETAPAMATCYDSDSRARLVEALRGPDWDAYEPEDHMFTLWYNRMAQYGIEAADIPRIQAKGIPVCVYTIDSEEQMREVLALGVRSILTDRPDSLAEVIDLLEP
jgi:glycerophosphoryl diester phosphodiesterase